MNEIKVKKEKVIREFREELNKKGLEKKVIYDESFFKILNRVYKLSPREIRCHISRLNSLVFLVILDHTYIYVEWSPEKEQNTLLSITITHDIDKGGIFLGDLEIALNKIDAICKTKI